MQKLYSTIIGLPVFDEYAFRPLALVQDIIIDPDKGHIVAFLLSKGRVVVPMDVSRITSGLFIQDKDHIVEIDEVQRVCETLSRQIPIMGAPVTNTKKVYLGKVVDYEIDTKTMSLSSIWTAKTFFFFRFSERMFSRKQILSITKEGIIVNDVADVPVGEPANAPSSAFA